MIRPDSLAEWTICIDPGASYCGVAAFRFQELVAGGLVKVEKEIKPDLYKRALELSDVVVQWATEVVNKNGGIDGTIAARRGVHLLCEGQQTRTKEAKGDQQVFVEMALNSGVLLNALGHQFPLVYRVHYVPPTTWKGTLPKDMMLRRIKSLITADELPRAKLNKDTLDAIGIGFWWTKRM